MLSIFGLIFPLLLWRTSMCLRRQTGNRWAVWRVPISETVPSTGCILTKSGSGWYHLLFLMCFKQDPAAASDGEATGRVRVRGQHLLKTTFRFVLILWGGNLHFNTFIAFPSNLLISWLYSEHLASKKKHLNWTFSDSQHYFFMFIALSKKKSKVSSVKTFQSTKLTDLIKNFIW